MTNTNQYKIDQMPLTVKDREWAWPYTRSISSSNFSKRTFKERHNTKSVPECAGPANHTTCPLTLGWEPPVEMGLGLQGTEKEENSPVHSRAEVEKAKNQKYLGTDNRLPVQRKLSGAVVCTFSLCDHFLRSTQGKLRQSLSPWGGGQGLGRAVMTLNQLLDSTHGKAMVWPSSWSSSVLWEGLLAIMLSPYEMLHQKFWNSKAGERTFWRSNMKKKSIY